MHHVAMPLPLAVAGWRLADRCRDESQIVRDWKRRAIGIGTFMGSTGG